MEIIREENDVKFLRNNYLKGPIPILNNSQIAFTGSGNLIYFENQVKLSNSKINFSGNHSIVYIAQTQRELRMNVTVHNHNVFYFGKNNYTNAPFIATCSEGKHLFFGDDCLLSLGLWFRNADPHVIHSVQTKERINPSKSIFIGDHVWIGQNAQILKGTKIYSGSIAGGGDGVSWKINPLELLRCGQSRQNHFRRNFLVG